MNRRLGTGYVNGFGGMEDSQVSSSADIVLSPDCPFLGIRTDPLTRSNVPENPNFCHRAKPPRPVRLDQQSTVCMGRQGEHMTCPLFQKGKEAKRRERAGILEGDSIRQQHLRTQPRLMLSAWLVIVFLALAFASSSSAGRPENILPSTGPSSPAGFASFAPSSPSLSPSATPTSVPASHTPTITPRPTVTPLPSFTPTSSPINLKAGGKGPWTSFMPYVLQNYVVELESNGTE